MIKLPFVGGWSQEAIDLKKSWLYQNKEAATLGTYIFPIEFLVLPAPGAYVPLIHPWDAQLWSHGYMETNKF